MVAALLCSITAQAPAQTHRPGIEAQLAHAHCPLPGEDERTLLIDSPAQWRAIVPTDEVQALGRKVRWNRERVLVSALAQQPTLGVRVTASVARKRVASTLHLTLVVTRPGPDEMAMTALSRPCVFVALTRGAWRQVRVVDAQGNELGVARVEADRPAARGISR